MARPLPLTITAPCLALLLSAACLNDNLDFDPSTGGATDSTTAGTSAGQTATATSNPGDTSTTSAGSSTAGGESDSSASETSDTTDGGDTTDSGDSPVTCPEGMAKAFGPAIPVIGDRVVISHNTEVSPCSWDPHPPDCRDDGFAGFVPMTNDTAYGVTYFLMKFDHESIEDAVDLQQTQTIGYQLRAVFYEENEIGLPITSKTLAAAAINLKDAEWDPATVTFLQRSSGSEWSGGPGGLVASLGPELATLFVDAAAAMEGEEEQPDISTTYHSKIYSSVIPPGIIEDAVSMAQDPSFAVYLIDPEPFGLRGNNNFGVKTASGGWSTPSLVPIFCQ